MKFNLGDKVKDKITGFKGTITSRTEFLNGCIQYGVQGNLDKEGKIPEPMGIDEQSLELLNPPKIKVEPKRTGGPNKLAFKPRGY